MSGAVIDVDRIGKRFRIGETADVLALRDSLAGVAAASLRRLRTRRARPSEIIWALRDVSFSVEAGEVLGIIGPNGAGKSTLLKILSRITEPTEGRAVLRGRVRSLLEVGTGFHPELTGRENVFLNGAILGMRRAEIRAKFDRIAGFAETGAFLDTPVKRYSSGMRMRLAFAVAAFLDPEILIVDEVLAVGDAAFQRRSLGTMAEVARGGRTVLFVSHDMSAVQRLCSRAILLEGGTLTYSGQPRDVVERYLAAHRDTRARRDDLRDAPRGHVPDAGVVLTECAVSGGDGTAAVLRYGEPLSVTVAAEATVEHRNLSVVVGIESMEGVRVLTAWSSEAGVTFAPRAGERFEVSADFQGLVLTPGLYQVFLSIRSGRRALDTVAGALHFEVSELAYGDTRPHTGAWGLVAFQPQWRARAKR